MRLDRLIGKWGSWGKRQVRQHLETGAVRVNGVLVKDGTILVGKFDRIESGDEVVQARAAHYVMLHKPPGVVSATIDEEHQTVLDLITTEWAQELHLAGRLDRFTSGLVILTNDSAFSEALTEPEKNVGKRYLVETDREMPEEALKSFREGLWFAKERVKTAPARVELLHPHQCRLTIYEGKHHQVKRMFAMFGLKVVALHREAIGEITLDSSLKPGEWRKLTLKERATKPS